MGFISFIATLAATGLLALVAFGVPSVFFLKASINVDGFNGSIIFGALSYCLELSNGTTCPITPSLNGYNLDINSLVGNNLPFEIPQALVKAVTHALAILHGLALIFAGASFLTGLVPLCGSCFRSLSSGFAAFITAGAFAVDLILFFGAKARISEVGSAQIGISIILTFVALVLLAVSSFFSICCFHGIWARSAAVLIVHILPSIRIHGIVRDIHSLSIANRESQCTSHLIVSGSVIDIFYFDDLAKNLVTSPTLTHLTVANIISGGWDKTKNDKTGTTKAAHIGCDLIVTARDKEEGPTKPKTPDLLH